ncbi:MAG: LytR C-terminal domain-containing protein [Candidatus Levybacteria bacterium]|nr:LytR C-terminal domain-containing protein [Candidatus Levybacteria bacterium]
MDNNILFSKIVATPTLNSWSQAYNAGKLFAVLSLEKTGEENQDLESLSLRGRNLLERLEQEFFTIEKKDLESIKQAIFNTFQETKEDISISFAAGTFIDHILYLFALGKGKAFIKRDRNFGIILDSTADPKTIASSSGFFKDNDLIVLATDAFSTEVTNDDLNQNLNDNLPTEIAESLAPKIHKAENGKISAIIIKCKPLVSKEPIADEVEEEAKESKEDLKIPSSLNKYLTLLKSKIKKPNLRFAPTRNFFLLATVIIACLLIVSVYLTIQNQNNAKLQALFSEIYPEAQKKYDEGENVLGLNKNLSRDSFMSAQKILIDNKNKFPAKSKEAIQIQDLLKKVESGLAQVSPVDKSGLDRSKLSITVENGSGIEGTAGKAAAILKTLGYIVSSVGNADDYNYKGVTIKVKKDKSEFQALLKKDLSRDYAITSTSSDLPSSFPTDTLIIIGK